MTNNATSENRFKLIFTEHNILNNSVLSAQIPNISHPVTQFQYQGNNIKIPGDNKDIGEITITFKLDENYENYIDIFDWMLYNIQYANDPTKTKFDSIEYLILDARYKPILSFKYDYVFPTSIEEILHTSQSAGADELEFSVTYQINDIRKNVI